MKNIYLIAAFLLSSFFVIAQNDQPNPQREEKVRALYVAYVTQQTKLTEEEAKSFWPVHAQYEAELRSAMTGNTDQLEKEQAVINVKKKYRPSFQKVIGAERTNSFFKMNDEFRQRLVDRLKNMKQRRANGGGQGIRKSGPSAPKKDWE